MLKKGAMGQYPRALTARPVGLDRFEVTLSVDFGAASCEFTAGEFEHIVAHLHDVLQRSSVAERERRD